MKLKYDKKQEQLTVDGVVYKATCNVRNEQNGQRKLDQLVYPIVGGVYSKKPYMPRTFPVGEWSVTSVEWTDNKVFAPCKIKTNAKQKLPLWDEKDGKYDKPTTTTILDEGYYLHHSNSSTTLGCIRIFNYSDANLLGKLVQEALKKGEKVDLEVV
ncbi:MAG: hypothetical protein ACRCZB_05480 [Bacteroidales bacterium]